MKSITARLAKKYKVTSASEQDAKEFVDRYAKNTKATQKDLEEFVVEKGFSDGDISELMYDLRKYRVQDLNAPKSPKSPTRHGAGVSVHLDCTLQWDEDKLEFEPTTSHALFTAADKSINTNTDDVGYSEVFEIVMRLPPSGDPDSMIFSLGKKGLLTLTENDDLYEAGSAKKLVLPSRKFNKGDSFEFRLFVDTHDPCILVGTATFTEDGENAWSDLGDLT